MKQNNKKSTNTKSDHHQFKFGRYWNKFHLAILLFVAALLLSFPYDTSLEIEKYPVAGEVAKETVIAPFIFDVYKSDENILREQRKAENQILPLFHEDSSSAPSIIARLDSVIVKVSRLQDTTLPDSLQENLHSALSVGLTEQDIHLFLENFSILKRIRTEVARKADRGILSRVIISSLRDMESIEKEYSGDVDYVYSSNSFVDVVQGSTTVTVSIDSLATIPELLKSIMKKVTLPPAKKRHLSSAIYHLINSTVEPTLIYDEPETVAKRKEAISRINPIKHSVIKDVEIVRKHQIVTDEIAEILQTLQEKRAERAKTQRKVLLFFSTTIAILLIGGVVILLNVYLVDFVPLSIDKATYFLALSVMVSLQLFLIRGGMMLLQQFRGENAFFNAATAAADITIEYSGIPVTVAILLAAVLFNRQTGFFLAIFFSAYIGIVTDFNLIASIEILITGGIAAHLGSSVRYRKDFIKLVLWMMVANSLTIIMAVIADHEASWEKVGYAILYAVSDAVLSVLLVNLVLPIFEEWFNITTDMTLMELADMNHPLLKKLSIEAPGTYNHSVLVANLAESAANEIGADALYCRVACYYHDIGKTKKPINFIENQRLKKNPHDTMPASRSARIIMGHVREGVEQAKQYKLPKVIIDAIKEHHGDALMHYFYCKARDEKRDDETLDQLSFTYGGPKPQTKETAIIMIADSVEAASRTLKNTSTNELRELAKKIVREKIFANQLDECGLTFDEVNKVINGFMPVLEGIFHSRIEYPDQEGSNSGA